MASFLVTHIPIAPEKLIKFSGTYEHQNSAEELIKRQNSTPQSSVKSFTDSDSSLSDESTTSGSVCLSQSRLSNASIKTEVYVKFNEDEAEFFAYNPSKGSPKQTHRKRDRIRSKFNKKFQRLKSDSSTSDTDSNDWNEMLAKSLINMHNDLQDIVNGFEAIEQTIPTIAEPEVLLGNLSFRERQRQKLEMIRMANMLNPPSLLTCDVNQSPYAYSDIIEPKNYNLTRMFNRNDSENLLIHSKPHRHRKLRYRIQRNMIKMKDNIEKLKYDVYGKELSESVEDFSPLNLQSYRFRLENTVIKVRQQIEEYDRINAMKGNSRKSISQIIDSMKPIDPVVQEQIDDYRSKLRPIKNADRTPKSVLISAPYIPRRMGLKQIQKVSSRNALPLDSRFNPTTFIDLVKDSEDFFGSSRPFWHRPLETRLSIALPLDRSGPDDLILPLRLGFWARVVVSFKRRQKELRNTQKEQIELGNNDEFFDCRTSLPNNKLQTQTSSDDDESFFI